MLTDLSIREIAQTEHALLGELMVDVYASLDGFPKPNEQPAYYNTLRKIGNLNGQAHTTVLVAQSNENGLLGGVVYFDDMSAYNAGGKATQEKQASGIRLLCVDPKARGQGVGKALTLECIRLAKNNGNQQVILHTTDAMKNAWAMYEKLGFKRSDDLDFFQKKLKVYGFRLLLGLAGTDLHQNS